MSTTFDFRTRVKVSLEGAADKPPHVQAAAAQEAEVRHNTFLLDIMELNIVTLQLTLMICCRGGCFDLFDGYVKSLIGRTSKI